MHQLAPVQHALLPIEREKDFTYDKGRDVRLCPMSERLKSRAHYERELISNRCRQNPAPSIGAAWGISCGIEASPARMTTVASGLFVEPVRSPVSTATFLRFTF